MAIDIDKSEATKVLKESYIRCSEDRMTTCKIKDTIDFVLNGKNCLTYRYIMFTALLAKAVNKDIDILSLQAGDESNGAYEARSLASKVVYQFQKSILGNILDGSNNDPLVNKPGRFLRLDKKNPAAGGDPRKALDKLCDELPLIKNQKEATQCIDYIVSLLLEEKTERYKRQAYFENNIQNIGAFSTKKFMSKLLDQGFSGAALVLVATALYHIQFSEENYMIIPHPVNQSGASKRQFSDLDLLKNGNPFMGTELKDKPFTAADVEHAAETACQAGASSLLFVAGRQSSFASQPPTYFNDARNKYESKGLYVGVTSIDDLMDTIFSCHIDMDATKIINIMRTTAEEIGALEAQIWIYENMANQARLTAYVKGLSNT